VDDFAAVLTALTEGGVEFVVVGGIAVVAHGYVRVRTGAVRCRTSRQPRT
jgi:hypothetical protein